MDARTSGGGAGPASGGGMYGADGSGAGGAGSGGLSGIDPMREIIVLAACGSNELLPQVRAAGSGQGEECVFSWQRGGAIAAAESRHAPQTCLDPDLFSTPTPCSPHHPPPTQNPDLPADVFTACLTTPIKVALRWFCSRSLLRHDGVTKELIDRWGGEEAEGARVLCCHDGCRHFLYSGVRGLASNRRDASHPPAARIPGRQTDRKTPLGELNWIFTAITDTIAWNSLPRATFQKLFRQVGARGCLGCRCLLICRLRMDALGFLISPPHLPRPPPQDLLVASLFRNFLLAERILAAANATPVSWPRLPPTHQHPMWQAWDMAAEMCLLQLPALLADPATEFTPSTFFSEQLTAFELWLAHGSADKKPPEQLPIVLQVLLSQVHRLRALVLLGRFLDMGLWAVELALSVGIFPYVLKLLQVGRSGVCVCVGGVMVSAATGIHSFVQHLVSSF
jgi:hypothetical protein